MTASIRFGNVLNAYNFGKEKSKELKAPNNRVLFHNDVNKTYIVTGPEDIESVDFLLANRDRLEKQSDTEAAKSLNNALYRFLIMKSHMMTTKWDSCTEKTIELL